MERGLRWAVEARRKREETRKPGPGTEGLVRVRDDRRETKVESGKGKGKRKSTGGKGEHGSKGALGSKVAQQNTKMTKNEDEKDQEEEPLQDSKNTVVMIMMSEEECETDEKNERVRAAPNIEAGVAPPGYTELGRGKERDTKADMGRL